jgi:hypothetical protein
MARQGWRLKKLQAVKLHGCSFTAAQGIEAEQKPNVNEVHVGFFVGAESPVPGPAD